MKVKQRPCNPGMKGCVLYGRFAFSDPDKNSPAIKRKLEEKTRSANSGSCKSKPA
jgi:hypothetical protein